MSNVIFHQIKKKIRDSKEFTKLEKEYLLQNLTNNKPKYKNKEFQEYNSPGSG